MHHDFGHYCDLLVLFSVLATLVYSLISFDVLNRFLEQGRTNTRLLAMAAIAMGLAVWIAHVAGMLALRMDVASARCSRNFVLSIVFPIIASFGALKCLTGPAYRGLRIAAAGLLTGLVIALMHFVSMASLQMPVRIHYREASVVISSVLAFGCSWLSFHVAFSGQNGSRIPLRARMFGAVLLGFAIASMHYVSLAGAGLVPAGGSSEGLSIHIHRHMLVAAGGFVLFILAAGWTSMYFEKRRAQQTAVYHERRFLSLFEHTPLMAACYDPHARRVVHANSALNRGLGYTEKDLADIDPEKLIKDRKERSMLCISVQKALGLSEPQEAEFHVAKKNGEELLIKVTLFTLTDDNKPLLYTVGRDITEQRATELELIRARQAAESANLAKSRFLATMNHEIRTPLNGIVGINELLQDSPISDSQRELLQIQQKSSHALLRILSDILDFSHIELDSISLQKSIFSLSACVEDCIHLFAVSAKQKGIRLEYAIDKTLPDALYGDPLRLRQVLANLLGNAVKFTDYGFVRLEAVRVGETDSQTERSTMIRFSVIDTGIGISPSQRDMLFLPFSQIDASSAGANEGAGLGLAVSKNLVKLMGGEIWMDDKRTDGSSFHIQIPFQTVAG